MKFRNLVVLIVALMMVFTSTVAFAGNKEYRIEEAGMTIKIPDDMYVFTRSTPADDPNLKALGFSHEGLLSSFELANIYLEAVNAKDFSEVLVIVEDSADADTNEFVKVESDSAAQYEAVSGGKKITVKFVSYAGKQSDKMIKGYEKIVESIRLDGKDKLPVAETKEDEKKEESSESSNSSENGTENGTENGEAPSENSVDDKNDADKNGGNDEAESRGYDPVTYCVIIIGVIMAIVLIVTRIIKKR